MAPKKLDKDAAERVRQAAAAAADSDEEPTAQEAVVDSLGRPVKHESLKERVDGFNTFTKHLRSTHNERVARAFSFFTFAMFTLPVLAYVVVYNLVLPRVGETRIAQPLMEDDDGNIVPDAEWTDPATMGAAHTVVTLYGTDRSMWAGAAAVAVVLVLKVAFVLVSFRLDAGVEAKVAAAEAKANNKKGGPKKKR